MYATAAAESNNSSSSSTPLSSHINSCAPQESKYWPITCLSVQYTTTRHAAVGRARSCLCIQRSYYVSRLTASTTTHVMHIGCEPLRARASCVTVLVISRIMHYYVHTRENGKSPYFWVHSCCDTKSHVYRFPFV